ncbi:phosphoglycerate mutase [Serratia plymuthica]|nr:phosphoglycerate mutase [Serratia plymuthica]
MLQVYLVRHGETEWNAARRIQGQSDSPLTAKGEHQAHLVARRVSKEGITHVITSDLGVPAAPRKSSQKPAAAK